MNAIIEIEKRLCIMILKKNCVRVRVSLISLIERKIWIITKINLKFEFKFKKNIETRSHTGKTQHKLYQ